MRTAVEPGQRFGHDALRLAEAVRGCGVDPVDPKIQRAVNRRNGLLVVLGAPAELPTTAADGPGTEPHPGDLHTGVPQPAGLELCLLHDSSIDVGLWTETYETRS